MVLDTWYNSLKQNFTISVKHYPMLILFVSNSIGYQYDSVISVHSARSGCKLCCGEAEIRLGRVESREYGYEKPSARLTLPHSRETDSTGNLGIGSERLSEAKEKG
jgi:hypothetical protein